MFLKFSFFSVSKLVLSFLISVFVDDMTGKQCCIRDEVCGPVATVASSSGKRNVTLRYPPSVCLSVCLSVPSAYLP